MQPSRRSENDSDSESHDESVRERFPRGKSPKRNMTGPGNSCTKKFRGAAIYNSKYLAIWPKTWPFIQQVKNDPHSFYCTVFRKSVSCKHQGERDVGRHAATTQHQKNSKALENTSQLKFVGTTDPVKEKVYININIL